jgi:hypothetical protein
MPDPFVIEMSAIKLKTPLHESPASADGERALKVMKNNDGQKSSIKKEGEIWRLISEALISLSGAIGIVELIYDYYYCVVRFRDGTVTAKMDFRSGMASTLPVLGTAPITCTVRKWAIRLQADEAENVGAYVGITKYRTRMRTEWSGEARSYRLKICASLYGPFQESDPIVDACIVCDASVMHGNEKIGADIPIRVRLADASNLAWPFREMAQTVWVEVDLERRLLIWTITWFDGNRVDESQRRTSIGQISIDTEDDLDQLYPYVGLEFGGRATIVDAPLPEPEDVLFAPTPTPIAASAAAPAPSVSSACLLA